MNRQKGRRDGESLNVFLSPWETELGLEGGVGAGGGVSLLVSVLRHSEVMQMLRQAEGKAE